MSRHSGQAGIRSRAAGRTQATAAGSWARYLTALLLFGSNGILASAITLPSTQIILLRTLLGSVLLLSLSLAAHAFTGIREMGRDLLYVSSSGLCMGISWMFQYEAYRRIGVSTTSLLYCVGPILVVVLAQLLFHERMSAGKLLCLTAVSAGAILTGSRTAGGGHSAIGVLCALLCAAAYAGMILLNKQCRSLRGLANASLQLSVAFLTSLVWTTLCRIAGTLPALTIPEGQLLPVLILGLLNTGLGCFLYFSGIAHLPAQSVAVCDYLEPLTAVLLAALVLRESLSPRQIAGAALILAGTAGWGLCQKKSPASAASLHGDPGCGAPLQEHSH